jgi:hypothetical protein
MFIDGKEIRTTLRPGEYAIKAPGVWHTADVLSVGAVRFAPNLGRNR